MDARIRRDLAIAQNLNDNLQKDVAELKAKLSARADAAPGLDASLQTGP